jgi:raffinose/stachyose/melibiose transport system permease protein
MKLKLPSAHLRSNLVLILVSAAIIFPLLFLVNTSLKSSQEFLATPTTWTSSLHWENFAKAWQEAKLGRYFLNTVAYAIGAVTLICLVNVMAAYPLARGHFRGANALYLLFVSGLFMPGSLVPMIYLMKSVNLMNTAPGYVLLLTGGSIPLTILILTGFIRTVPREIDEAAVIDGCSYLRFIFTILVPLIKPALATVALLNSIGVWNDFIGPLIYLPDPAKRTLSSGLYVFFGQFSTNWTIVAASILIIVVPILVIYIFLQRYIVAGITTGAVKG